MSVKIDNLLRVWKNRVLKGIFERKREDVKEGGCIKRHNEDPTLLCCSLNDSREGGCLV
jgi:hypothetical protein